MNVSTRLLIAAAVLTASIPATAGASGFLVARFGGEQGHPTTNHPSAIYFNPAGLAFTTGTHLYVEGLFGIRTASYNRPVAAIDNVVPDGQTGTAGTPSSATSANAGEAKLSNLVAAPFIAVTSDLGIRNLGVGAGVYVPFGGNAKWDQNSEYAGNDTYPGAVDGVARWGSIEGSIQSLYATAAGAYYFPELRLSVGVGLNVVMTSVNTIRARNASGTDDLLTTTGSLQEGRSVIDVSNTTFSLGIGAIMRPTNRVALGLSYQSRPNFGTTNLKGKLRTKLALAAPSEDDIELRWPLPDVLRAGITVRPIDRVEVRLFGDFVRWSVVDDHCGMTAATADQGCRLTPGHSGDSSGAVLAFNIPRHWEDAFSLRVGASYWLTNRRELFVGLGYDGSAVPDETMAPDIIDQTKMTASVGARVLLTDNILISGTFTQVVYFEREVGVRTSTFDSISRTPDGAGTYNQSVSLFNLGLDYMF